MTNYSGHRDQKYGHVTYAQHGDDLMLVNIFSLLHIDKPSYLDVGAHHPVNISNTKLLYDRGSRGVNVEANPNLIKEFELQRPEDINLNVGVATESGIKTFYMYDDKSGRNTFSEEETRSLEGVMTVRTAIQLPVVTLNHIVDTHCGGRFPDLLSIDIEGLDFDVLTQTDFRASYPKVIIVEVRRHDTGRFTLMMYAQKFLFYCRMGENLIFVHSSVLMDIQ